MAKESKLLRKQHTMLAIKIESEAAFFLKYAQKVSKK